MVQQIESTNSKQTEDLGRQIGKRLRGGEVIELISDLGGGKTTFVHGLADGVGSKDNVASPTFTINRLYKGNAINVQHFDFYRLSEAGLMADELAEIIDDPTNVIVIEWAQIVHDLLPGARLTINFINIGENERRLELTYPEALNYLVKDLKL